MLQHLTRATAHDRRCRGAAHAKRSVEESIYYKELSSSRGLSRMIHLSVDKYRTLHVDGNEPVT
jgi:hypothetical protein